jgi:uncharacterized membrane protein
MNATQYFFRWLHVFAGIIWIGHLYFFNFVNVPLQGALDDASKKLVNPKLLPRALWWFRWGAMVTFLSGLILYGMIYRPGLIQPSPWIMMGMTFGIIMWFNVWFIIWPTNRKILAGLMPAESIAAARKKAGMASRLNTYLSGPMLFGMLGPSHGVSAVPAHMVLAIAAGALAIWVAIFHSFKVGQSV